MGVGKVRVGLVKRLARELSASYPDDFSTDFVANKRLLQVGSLLKAAVESGLTAELDGATRPCVPATELAAYGGLVRYAEGAGLLKRGSLQKSKVYVLTEEGERRLGLHLPSKKLRNRVAGYIARLKRAEASRAPGEVG